MTHDKMPERIWVYNRDGKLEARDASIVVGNVEYVRADLYDYTVASYQELERRLSRCAALEQSHAKLWAALNAMDKATENTTYPPNHPIWEAVDLKDEAIEEAEKLKPQQGGE